MKLSGYKWSAALCANISCVRSGEPFLLATSSLNRPNHLVCDAYGQTRQRWIWGECVARDGDVYFERDPRDLDEEPTTPGGKP